MKMCAYHYVNVVSKTGFREIGKKKLIVPFCVSFFMI